MPRQATKALSNRYYQARMRAAEGNEKFLTRTGAAEFLPGVTEDSLKKYELDITRPPNEVVSLMADAYREPELIFWYCSNECPLGKYCREVPEMPPERMFIRVTNTLNRLTHNMEELAKILDDGIVDESEKAKVREVREDFIEARRRIDEALAGLERLER